MKYDADYFIAKFEAIPPPAWFSGEFVDTETGACCARGHCGERSDRTTREAEALMAICVAHLGGRWVAYINDGTNAAAFNATERYPQVTAKQRVLAWLRDAKEAGL